MASTISQYQQFKQKTIQLKWKNISLIQKKTDKYILDRLSGQVKSGDFLTIMGPSGAGKSSFLSIITGKLSSYTGNFKIKGKLTLNNKKYSQQQFTSIASYVPQDDLLLETMTVKQTLDFQAKLKLYKKSDIQKQYRVNQVLKILNLYEIRDSYVGGRLRKSISGGQKKRLVIGVQLISDPLCLILDQPTSGLDSFNSLIIIQILSRLAKQQNKLVIATIHQPSTIMFQNFNKLIILKNGRLVYFNQASNVVTYMQNIGVKVDYRMNPADFFMLQLSTYLQQKGHLTKMTAQQFQTNSQNSMEKEALQLTEQNFQINKAQSIPFLDQFKPLIIRNFKNFSRCPSNIFGRLMQMICFPIFIGSLYFDLLSQLPDVKTLTDLENFLIKFSAFLFLALFFCFGQTFYDTILSCTFLKKNLDPSEQELVMKEVHSNMYSLNMYYITKLIIQIPGMILPVYFSTTIVYIVCQLQKDFQHWFFFESVFTFLAASGCLMGIITGIAIKNQNLAINSAPIVIIPLVLYGGLVVNLNTLPFYSGWLQYLTPLRYSFNALVQNQLQTDALYHLGDLQLVRQKLGLSGTISQNMIGLIINTFAFLVISFVLLYARKKFG